MTEESKPGQGRALATIRVASLWLLAGALFKLFAGSPADLPGNLIEFIGKSNISLFFRCAIAIELAVVTLVWLKPKLGWFFLAGNLAVFIVVLFGPAMEGAESCGCFGGSITIPPYVMMGIDGVLLLAILATRPWSSISSKGGSTIAALVLIAVGAVAPFVVIDTSTKPAPISSGQGEGDSQPVVTEQPRYAVFEFDQWIGKSIYDADFPLTPHLDGNIEELASDGKWIFWRLTCSHCAEHLRELAASYGGEPLVLIRDHEAGEDELTPEVTLMPEGPSVQHVSLRKGTVYLMTTPVEMTVAGGDVISAEENVGAEEE